MVMVGVGMEGLVLCLSRPCRLSRRHIVLLILLRGIMRVMRRIIMILRLLMGWGCGIVRVDPVRALGIVITIITDMGMDTGMGIDFVVSLDDLVVSVLFRLHILLSCYFLSFARAKGLVGFFKNFCLISRKHAS